MKQIDWSQAPDGATHWNTKTMEFIRPIADGWESYIDPEMGWRWEWCGTFSDNYFAETMIPRPTTQTWSGEGLPPVGWEGQYKPYWHACEIVAEHKGFLVVWDAHDLEYFRTKNASIFRPLKSPRDRWVEAAHDKCTLVDDNDFVRAVLGQAYDAMQSGALPIPEAEQ